MYKFVKHWYFKYKRLYLFDNMQNWLLDRSAADKWTFRMKWVIGTHGIDFVGWIKFMCEELTYFEMILRTSSTVLHILSYHPQGNTANARSSICSVIADYIV